MTQSDGGSVALLLASRVPLLVLRFGTGYLRYLGRRRRGVHTFHETLLAGGMPPDRASQLADAFHEVGSLPNLIRGAAFGRRLNRR